MHNSSIYTLIILVLTACGANHHQILQATAEQRSHLKDYQMLEDEAKSNIAGPNEPGERLYLCGQLKKYEDSSIIPNQYIYMYHTDNKGVYELKDTLEPSSSRLNGHVTTDAQGRFYVSTILPNGYDGTRKGGHIHSTIDCARPASYDILFEQYTSVMGRQFAYGSDQHFLTELFQLPDSALVVFVTIYAKRCE